MRYTNEITFVKESPKSHYDPESGEWIKDEPKRSATIANVTDLGTERRVKIFGDIRQGAKVIRTLPLFSLPEFDYIEFESKTYKEITVRNPSGRNSLIVQEVSVDG
ncbi:hypothetical protein JZO77_05990 [Enterococcus hulanensis]|uniref:hypothetical protein n=1 Tax=Enterococcus hulanensis TaxID=2559929 RepID=UPI001A8E8E77|nr:hypothetical protein [Enterococcus hulanensis]MBO0456288.1 hypothetical protein [Enterococcus hulanensis]